jgi:hypothetical protein
MPTAEDYNRAGRRSAGGSPSKCGMQSSAEPYREWLSNGTGWRDARRKLKPIRKATAPTEVTYAVALSCWSLGGFVNAGDKGGTSRALAISAASIHDLAICRKMSRSWSVLALFAHSTRSVAYSRYSFSDDMTRGPMELSRLHNAEHGPWFHGILILGNKGRWTRFNRYVKRRSGRDLDLEALRQAGLPLCG